MNSPAPSPNSPVPCIGRSPITGLDRQNPTAAEEARMSESTLFVLQRLSAKLLAPLVIAHLVLILYAVHGGLSAGGDTRPNPGAA